MANREQSDWGDDRNGTDGFYKQGEIDPRKGISRPFTLLEALPFSPQTSTVPFLPDILPDPVLGSGSPALHLSDMFPSLDFDSLNNEARKQDDLPKKAKMAVDMVLHDLKPSQRTPYNFRTVSRNTKSSSSGKSLAEDLSPITKAVYDRVGHFFKATKSNASPLTKVNGQRVPKPTKNDFAKTLFSPSNTDKTPQQLNSQAHLANLQRIEVAIPKRAIDDSDYVDSRIIDVADAEASAQLHQEQAQFAPAPVPKVTPVPLPRIVGQPSVSKLHIELPATDINHDDYIHVAVAPDAPQELSTRRDSEVPGHRIVGESLDQRQRGEAALDVLDRLLRSIFTAVGNSLELRSGYEHVVTVVDQEVTLTSTSQQKIHSALHKVISLKCFGSVPVEHLLQVMKLSEGSFKQPEELDIRLDESWDEAAFSAWIQRLEDLDVGLKASRTCLRILSGGREEKQLYSEYIIQAGIDLFKAVTEDVIVPIVELRNSGPSAALFKMIAKQKKTIGSLFSTLQKLYVLLASLVTKIQLSESVINTLEYSSSRLIFIENAYYEKDSAIGVQKFDAIRSVAMDMLCQIFLIKPLQRQGIVDDILTSLEKLPVGKQSSRQFKLSDGASIQPVSALIMRLVQASSGRVDQTESNSSVAVLRNIGEDKPEGDGVRRRVFTVNSDAQGGEQPDAAIQDLESSVTNLTDAMHHNATYVINFLVTRAMGSSKSGDTPYRNLLDLFVDDFMTCLDSPDWPSAELLLRLLMLMMVQIFEAGKTAAPAKNMALEILGSLSATISRLRSQVEKSVVTLEDTSANELTNFLGELASHVLEHRNQIELFVSWTGPFRITLEYLQSRCADDPHLAGAISFLIADWATRLCTGYDAVQDDDDPDRDQSLGQLAYRLRMMIEDKDWLVNEYTFKTVTPSQAKLSYSLLLLRSPLCESFNKILNILLGSMASDQATVRSKSLKSINQVLETDPSILDGDSQVIQLIIECSSDSSTQVRDSALGLLGNCITMRPSLESSLTNKILIDRFQDAGVGVRKRAMKLARDIYLRNRDKGLRSAIANGLLRRVQDPDEGVRDLARQMIEEVWFAPFYQLDDTAEFQTSLAEHVALVIQTVKTGTVTETLDKVFQAVLKPQNREKTLDGPSSVCLQMVAIMFGMINNMESDDPTIPSGKDALQVLTIFAKAEPKLFNMEQVRLLKPQLASFGGSEELNAFRAVTVIYKRVLSELPRVGPEFLQEIRGQLQKAVGKISSRGAFDDLIACLKVCCTLLKDFGPLANLVASGILGIQKLPLASLSGKPMGLLSAYSLIVGCVAKHCDLDQQIQIFRARFPTWQGDSVPRLIVDTLSPFAAPNQPLDARKAALEAIGFVCQAWPRNYVIAKVYTAFQQVFHDQIATLESMILRSFKEFLMLEERRSEQKADGIKQKTLTVMGGTNFDDVASATTQRFLKDITRIAASSQDDHAFLAMEVLGSINRQGLTHPKETGVTLITLETSANRKIAELAFIEHRSLHEKHETVLEREYVKAVQSAFYYQRDIIKDTHGATTDPYQSKLHLLMEVLKISKMKNRQRFYEKLCAQVDFDLDKLGDQAEGPPEHLAFSQFVTENLAFFDYQTVGEVQTTIDVIEKLVASTGAVVAQGIESDIFNMRMDVEQPAVAATTFAVEEQDNVPEGSAPLEQIEVLQTAASIPPRVDRKRLRQLSSGAIILLAIWEVRSHLRKLYGQGSNRHEGKVKGQAKDLNKAPTKAQGVHQDKLWEELQGHYAGILSPEAMMQKCKAFVEFLNVDKEFQVANEEEVGVDIEEPATPSAGEQEDGLDRGRKRKAGASTPGGRKRRAHSNSQTRKKGRARKSGGIESPEEDAEGEFDGDWF